MIHTLLKYANLPQVLVLPWS